MKKKKQASRHAIVKRGGHQELYSEYHLKLHDEAKINRTARQQNTVRKTGKVAGIAIHSYNTTATYDVLRMQFSRSSSPNLVELRGPSGSSSAIGKQPLQLVTNQP